MKKFAILCVICSLLLCACSAGGQSHNSSEDPDQAGASAQNQPKREGHSFYSPSLPKVNFAGETVTIAVSAHKEQELFPSEQETGEIAQNKREVWEHIRKIYDCNVSILPVSQQDWGREVIPQLLSGKQYAYLLLPDVPQAAQLMAAGVCKDLNDPAYSAIINMKGDWWCPAAVKASTVGTATYSGLLQLDRVYNNAWLLFYNKGMMNEVFDVQDSLPDLDRMYKKQWWTWEELSTLIKHAAKDLDQNSIFDETDRYGLAAASDSVAAVAAAAGIDCAEPMQQAWTDPWNRSSSISSLKKLQTMYHADGVFHAQTQEQAISMFTQGKSLFLAGRLDSLSSEAFADKNEEFGILPIPTLQKQQEYTYLLDGDITFGMIPCTVSTPTRSAVLLEELMYDFWYLHREPLQKLLVARLGDDLSEQIAMTALDYATISMTTMLKSFDGGAYEQLSKTPLRNLFENAQYNVEQGFSKIAQQVQNVLQRYWEQVNQGTVINRNTRDGSVS